MELILEEFSFDILPKGCTFIVIGDAMNIHNKIMKHGFVFFWDISGGAKLISFYKEIKND